MQSTYEQKVSDARNIERQICEEGGKNVGAYNFGRVAKLLWPVKTAAALAAIAKSNPRTAERWLSGEYEPPICIVLATIDLIFKRQ